MNAEEKKIKLLVTPAPHVKDTMSGARMMQDTLISLTPAVIAAIILFGTKAVLPIVVSIITAVLAELGMLKFRKLPVAKADISSAALTGLLLALTLPPALPWWTCTVGSVAAIVIAKHFFGGLGYNIFNPALVGRAFLVASWPLMMTTWLAPLTGIDAVTTATPLAQFKPMALTKMAEHVPIYIKLLLGNHGGSIGETCAIALILGGMFLLWRKVIEWRIPLSYIGTVAVFSMIFNEDPAFHVLAGGLLLGTFFMATDPVTSPVTKPGRWIFGIGCGVITMVIRLWGGYPEGVCYSILLMNATVPLLDRYFKGRTFGT